MRARAFSALVLAACGGLSSMDDPREHSCGDGWIGPGEECDLGSSNSDQEICTSDCRNAYCGDRLVGWFEDCDDGNDDPTDGCDACESPFARVWDDFLSGAESIAVGPDDRVYVAGLFSGSPPKVLAVYEGTSGGNWMGDPYSDLVSNPSMRGPLNVAAHAGGAVIAGHFSFGDADTDGVIGWYDDQGNMEHRYQLNQPGLPVQVWGVNFAADGTACMAGSLGSEGMVLFLRDGEYVWDLTYNAPGGSLVLTGIDADSSLTYAMIGYQKPASPLVGLDRVGGAGILWSHITGPMGDGDSARDVRILPDGIYTARNWSDSIQHAVLLRYSNAGVLQDEIELDVPDYLELAGIRILFNGRSLTYGKLGNEPWLAVHAPDGSLLWRALFAGVGGDIVIDADSIDGSWVFAIVNSDIVGTMIVAWHF